MRDRTGHDGNGYGGAGHGGAGEVGWQAAGRDKPSVYEVARRAGVSTATVSRVLAGH